MYDLARDQLLQILKIYRSEFGGPYASSFIQSPDAMLEQLRTLDRHPKFTYQIGSRKGSGADDKTCISFSRDKRGDLEVQVSGFEDQARFRERIAQHLKVER